MAALCFAIPAQATIEGSLAPESVVAEWSDTTTFLKIIDIIFSDATWPDTWTGETGKDCPSYSDGGYVNAILDVPANGGTTVTYPVLFHNCIFANKESYNGRAGATAAFCRQYYLGESYNGNATYPNNWTAAGHTKYIEDNITYDTNGTPNYGEAGFVQMCRDAATEVDGEQVSMHGWMEIDHLPYVERIQWAWSSTAWGRGIKCDIKIGDGDWTPLVWMGYGKHKIGYTSFSDQGYFMENVINASDVSLRWRVWDGEREGDPVQTAADGSEIFTTYEDPMAQQQAPRVHKLRIFGNEITAEEAAYAMNNPVSDVGELTDLGTDDDDSTETAAPDADAPISIYVVAQDGSGDYTAIQDAIDAVPEGGRGLIYIRPGTYAENLYAGESGGVTKYISLIGEDKTTTILTSDVSRGTGNESNTYSDCAALNVLCDRFYAENLTIQNTSGNVGQAEALYTSGDAHIFNNVVIKGYQDTYKANVGARGYFTNSTIIGATDFIYDSGMEWFEGCEIQSLNGGQYITAPGDASLTMTNIFYPELSVSPFYAGLFFRNCTLTAEDGTSEASYYLGRPWKEQSGAAFINCTLGNHIKSEGWAAWSGSESNSSLVEYKNKDTDGQLVDTSSRASFSYQLSQSEVEAYMTPEFMFGELSEVPFDYVDILEGADCPMNFAIGDTEITWECDDDAAAYLIYKDGEFLTITTEKLISKDADDDSEYSVRSVSRHGVTSALVKATEATQILAFPTAEGFGKYATGGRGGQVVTVTSLADDGSEGTLRWAVAQYPDEPLTIVFAVSGQITLTSELSIKRNDWTLAGQTAPGDGIVIARNKVNMGGSENFIVRNLRFRAGAFDTDSVSLMDNAVGAENCANYIFDHCSFGWSVEENMNTADSHFLTVQYSMVHEGLYDGGHSKGARGYASQWGGSPATYHHNLLANNYSRSPRFNGARGEDYVVFIEYINNVNYNFGKSNACYGGENTADITEYNGLNSAHECNFMNNYYKPGSAYTNASSVKYVESSYARSGATSWAPAQWYVDGNVIEGNTTGTSDNWSAMTAETYSLAQIKSDERIVPETAYYKYSALGNIGTYIPSRYMMYDFETAAEAFNTVVAGAGTINRDKVEQRIADEASSGSYTYTGSKQGLSGIIDLESDAEGFFDYSTDYTVPTDTDGDGMPDEWETENGLDPAVADQNTLNADGYTALEVYLNSLMGESQSKDFSTGITALSFSTPTISYAPGTSTLNVSDDAIGATLRVYSTDGRMMFANRITSAQTDLSNLPSGILLLQVEGKGITPRMLKVVK